MAMPQHHSVFFLMDTHLVQSYPWLSCCIEEMSVQLHALRLIIGNFLFNFASIDQLLVLIS